MTTTDPETEEWAEFFDQWPEPEAIQQQRDRDCGDCP
jgi:hypothetical protein